jgi:single-stranded-DNA-specific exonuclease
VLALLAVAGRDARRALASDLGFAVGPRLNAAGRLADMSQGIELLLCDDPARAHSLAAELDDLNRARREIERDMKQQAQAIVARLPLGADARLPAGLCLFDAEWHQGVIGIVASRIKDLHHRPTIAFAPGDAGELKGSARSIPGVHVRDVLDAIAASHPGLLGRFGGHAMAAGLALRAEDLPRFEAAFAAEVARRVDESVLERVILSDGELAAADFTLDLARSLNALVPWGQGFPEPVFDGVFRILERRVVGEHHLRLTLERPGGGALPAIAFNARGEDWAGDAPRIHAAYRLAVNEWQAVESLQLVIEHAVEA